ncbi:MAG TPA: glycosyltransferase [Steroidobacteraceae bacterium]|nr:glycosyltransferase [Steroidobacteraceae bacterium]
MRALLYSNLFPTSRDANRGLFTRQIAAELARLCDLEVAVPLPWFPSGRLAARLAPAYAREFGALAARQEFDGVVATYPRYPLIPRLSERAHDRFMYLGVRGAIARRHRERPFDVINAHWLYPDGVVAVRIGALLKLPVVLTGLGCDVNEDLRNPAKRTRILDALHAAAAITTVSQPLADVLREAGVPADRITVIPNGVDTARFSPGDQAAARRTLGLDAGPLVVCVSRLSHEKGVDVLVDAASRLGATLPAARFVVVGEGPERPALEARIAAAALGDRFRLAGSVPHATVATWMTAADVIAMPSRREGHPNAAMEALACGRPLVASQCGALTELVTASRGLAVPPADAAALATAMAAALTRTWDHAAIAASMREESWSRAAASYYRVLERAATSPIADSARRVAAA